MAEIILEDLTKYFGKTRAAEDVNLKIDDGEFIAILGPSGCGKTTVLRLIAGLETPTKGKIYFDDKLVNRLSPPDRNVAMVFQDYMLYPTRTAFGNIEFPLEVRGVPKEEREERVRKTAELLEVEELLDRKPGDMSGGQRQRVALGRAIIREPNAFLMDEPLANLDAKLRVLMRYELKRLQEKLGVTTVYVTHDQVEAMTMAKRSALLNEGLLHQVGTPSEVYNRPADTWVAGFIGSPPMNLLDATLEEEDGKWLLRGDGFFLSIEEELADLIVRGKSKTKLKLGVRPSDLTVYRKEEPNSIKGKIHTKEPLGKEVIINVGIGDNLVKAEIPRSEYPASTGDEIYLKPNEKKIYLYDKNGELLT